MDISKKYHIVGIGGIGMSAYAKVMHGLGIKVQGSDMSENANVSKLRDIGISVYTPQSDTNIDTSVDIVVRSTAVPDSNSEILESKKLGIPVWDRATLLAELMRLKKCIAISGTHGKTTTTGFIYAALQTMNPSLLNGGILKDIDSNAKFDSGDWMIVEADESDGTFNKLHYQAAILTNIDDDHLSTYSDSFDVLRSECQKYLNQVPNDGFAIACLDCDAIKSRISLHSHALTYSINDTDADFYAQNIQRDGFGMKFECTHDGKSLGNFTIKLPGLYNVSNAIAAIATGVRMNIPINNIKQGIAHFSGIKRRFETIRQIEHITIVHDYAHHPTETRSAIDAAHAIVGTNNVISIIQPHRYSRLKQFARAFTSMNPGRNILTNVFPAGESPEQGWTLNDMLRNLTTSELRNSYLAPSIEDCNKAINHILKEIPKDQQIIILLMGAGDIVNWAKKLELH